MAKEKEKSYSLTELAWKRLKKDKLSIFGLLVILLSAVVAILGANIRPDSTPDANDQILQLATKKPGFTIPILKVCKNNEEHHSNFFTSLCFGGEESEFTQVPINRYHFIDAEIVIEEYVGDNKPGPEKRFDLIDVVYPLSLTSTAVHRSGDNLSFYTYNNNQVTKSIKELQAEIIKNNIIEHKFYLGTDGRGRDMLSRFMAGCLVSLGVGFISVFI